MPMPKNAALELPIYVTITDKLMHAFGEMQTTLQIALQRQDLSATEREGLLIRQCQVDAAIKAFHEAGRGWKR